MDLLSDILLSLKLRSLLISSWSLGGHWGFDTATFPGGYCMNVVAGQAWFGVAGKPLQPLQPGDSVLVPRGGAYVFTSSPTAQPLTLAEIWREEGFPGFDFYKLGESRQVSWGGTDNPTHLLGLAFAFQPGIQCDLLNALPNAVVLPRQSTAVFPSIQPAIDYLTNHAEQNKPGYKAIAMQLAELVITSQLRTHILSGDSHSIGWLKGLQDPKISKALTAIHTTPQHPWTVTALAQVAGHSRSGFALRFQQLIGQSPIDYLNSWRVQLAAERLATTSDAIGDVLGRVGFNSDRAFRRLFKEKLGCSPQTFRRDRAQTAVINQ